LLTEVVAGGERWWWWWPVVSGHGRGGWCGRGRGGRGGVVTDSDVAVTLAGDLEWVLE
jgi:hypothetical protein